MAIPASGRTSALKRRSIRIPLNSSVAVSGEDRSKCSFTIGAKATGLNKHGGAIQITRELLVGTTVLVRNKRGTQISARVVSQIKCRARFCQVWNSICGRGHPIRHLLGNYLSDSVSRRRRIERNHG